MEGATCKQACRHSFEVAAFDFHHIVTVEVLMVCLVYSESIKVPVGQPDPISFVKAEKSLVVQAFDALEVGSVDGCSVGLVVADLAALFD